MNEPTPTKPLGHKSYGSIGHLPGSRMEVKHAQYGTGKVAGKDFGISLGQAKICTEKTRDRHDIVIVQEKLDGSNVSVANIDGELVALTRAGRLAQSSPYEQHQLFACWLRENADLFCWLVPGCRVCGEWLAQAHGTRYRIYDDEVFIAFDLMEGSERRPFDWFEAQVVDWLPMPATVSKGPSPLSIKAAMSRLERMGRKAEDEFEGAVWRVERHGKVDFLAKYVRPDKVDGCYLPEVSGKPAVWNWHPDHTKCWWYNKESNQ